MINKLNKLFDPGYLFYLKKGNVDEEELNLRINEMKRIFNEHNKVDNDFIVELFMKNSESKTLITHLEINLEESLKDSDLAQVFLNYMTTKLEKHKFDYQKHKELEAYLNAKGKDPHFLDRRSVVMNEMSEFEKMNTLFIRLYEKALNTNISFNQIFSYKKELNKMNNLRANNTNIKNFYGEEKLEYLIDKMQHDDKKELIERIKAIKMNVLYVKREKEDVKAITISKDLPIEAEEIIVKLKNNIMICLNNKSLLGEEEIITIQIINNKRLEEVINSYLLLKDAPEDLVNRNGKNAKDLLITTLNNYNEVIDGYINEIKSSNVSNKKLVM